MRLKLAVVFVAVFSPGVLPAGERLPLQFGADAAMLLQFNGTPNSQLTPVSTLFRIHGDFRFTGFAGLYARTFISGGRNTLHGLPGAWVPVNDIAVYPREFIPDDDVRPRFRADSVFLYLRSSTVRFSIGLINTDLGDGVMQLPGITTATSGFISAHLTRMAALHFLEKEQTTSIPAFLFFWRIGRGMEIRAGMTFGNSAYHFFIRNTGWLELVFKPAFFSRPAEIRLALGASDADESGTHQMSPAAGILFRQPLGELVTIFGGYSRTEEETPVSVLFGSFRWHAKGGLTLGRKDGPLLGVGGSVVRAYAAGKTERLLEVFFRFRPASWITMTPDIQIIHHPAGTTLDGQSWAFLAGWRVAVTY